MFFPKLAPVPEGVFKHLGEAVDLVVKSAVGKGAQLREKGVQSIKRGGQPDPPLFNLPGLGQESLGLVDLAYSSRWPGKGRNGPSC